MKARVFQHIWFEDGGSIAKLLSARGYEVSTTRFDKNEPLPPIEGIDFLAVMGGFMSVNDESEFPWLAGEKAFVREAAKRGVKTLGICLGAQMIASAFGAKVYKNEHKEIGWHKISSNAPFLPNGARVFHWHGETFDLPNGARLAASSEGCENQAFLIGSNVAGLQFHVETTPRSARMLVENCRHELLEEGRYIQSESEILGQPQSRYDDLEKIAEQLLDYLILGEMIYGN